MNLNDVLIESEGLNSLHAAFMDHAHNPSSGVVWDVTIGRPGNYAGPFCASWSRDAARMIPWQAFDLPTMKRSIDAHIQSLSTFAQSKLQRHQVQLDEFYQGIAKMQARFPEFQFYMYLEDAVEHKTYRVMVAATPRILKLTPE